MLGAERVLWKPQQEISSEDDLEAFHDRVSIARRLGGARIAYASAALLSVGIYLLGLGISSAVGLGAEFLDNPFPLAFSIDLFIAIGILVWGDTHLVETLTDCRSAFDVKDERFYGFFGTMVERIYEHVSFASRPDGRRVHRPTAAIAVLGLTGFVVIPALAFSAQLGTVVGMPWNQLPLLLQLYFLLLLVVAVLLVTVYVWPIAVAVIYMGFKVQSFDIKLDITREHTGLGLKSYARLIVAVNVGYLLLLMVSGTMLIRRLTPIYLVGFALLSLLPIIGYIGSQYGLHVAIKRSKRKWLKNLREEYSEELDQWFPPPSKAPTFEADDEIETVIAAKEEVQSLPDWPIHHRVLGELLLLSLTSNLPLVFRMFFQTPW